MFVLYSGFLLSVLRPALPRPQPRRLPRMKRATAPTSTAAAARPPTTGPAKLPSAEAAPPLPGVLPVPHMIGHVCLTMASLQASTPSLAQATGSGASVVNLTAPACAASDAALGIAVVVGFVAVGAAVANAALLAVCVAVDALVGAEASGKHQVPKRKGRVHV